MMTFDEYYKQEREAEERRIRKIYKEVDSYFEFNQPIPKIPLYITPEAYQYFRQKIKIKEK